MYKNIANLFIHYNTLLADSIQVKRTKGFFFFLKIVSEFYTFIDRYFERRLFADGWKVSSLLTVEKWPFCWRLKSELFANGWKVTFLLTVEKWAFCWEWNLFIWKQKNPSHVSWDEKKIRMKEKTAFRWQKKCFLLIKRIFSNKGTLLEVRNKSLCLRLGRGVFTDNLEESLLLIDRRYIFSQLFHHG